jgi:hypothetical protein
VFKGLVAEVDGRTVTSTLNTAARSRRDEFVSAKRPPERPAMADQRDRRVRDRVKDRHHAHPSRLHSELLGGDPHQPREDLAVDDEIAVGPHISPKAWMNVHARVVAMKGARVEVELDPGDRDRLQRGTGKEIPERTTIPLDCQSRYSHGPLRHGDPSQAPERDQGRSAGTRIFARCACGPGTPALAQGEAPS